MDDARRTEQTAYEALTEAQALGLVPKYFGRVRIDMNVGTSIHPALDAIDGLLMEYIPGRLMSSIRPGRDISIVDISQRILNLARRLRRYGVSHNDLHSNNIILRHGNNDPILIDWGRPAFHPLYEKTFAARWMHHAMSTDFHKDVRKILMHSDGNIWHRFTTSGKTLFPETDGICQKLSGPTVSDVFRRFLLSDRKTSYDSRCHSRSDRKW